MHEIGIANSILNAVRAEAALHPDAYPRKVAVRIGELAAVDADALRFCFEALTRDTDLESLNLEIEICPRRQRCSACGVQFDVIGYDFRCPQCSRQCTECVGGEQLELVYLEMEEHEPSTA